MSTLQRKAKPLLLPLLHGETWPTFILYEQEVIAAWATMFTMVYEFGDPRTSAIPQHERSHLKTTKQPPNNWRIWIGIFDGTLGQGKTRHHVIALAPQKPIPIGITVPYNTQVTTFSLGSVFFQTFSSALEQITDSIVAKDIADDLSIASVWPQSGLITEPSRRFDDIEIEALHMTIPSLLFEVFGPAA